MYHFIWHTYCDWYIEFSKILFQKNSNDSEETKKVAIWVFIQILKMAHPIMPFITEQLWRTINDDKNFLMNQLYENHKINGQFIDSQLNVHNLTQIISAIRNLRSELNIPYKEQIDINFSNNDPNFVKFLYGFENELKKILKLNKLSFDLKTKKTLGTAYIVVGDTTLTIPLKNIIDTKKEVEKLEFKKNKELVNLKNISSKLSNSTFLIKAPEEVVEQFKKQANEIKSSIDKIDQIIDTIK